MDQALVRTSERGLPLLVHKGNRIPAYIVGFAIASALYLSSNHYPIFTPIELKMTFIDQWVPFIPETVWIYVTEYPLFLVVYFTAKDYLNINKYMYSFLAMQSFAVLIFFLWPTTFPRGQFPLIEGEMDSLTYSIFSQLRVADTPNNCAPSLHVSSVYLSSFIFLDEQRSKFKWFFLWATLIAFSTLTTKQHYLIDLVTGLLMAILFYWIFHKLVPYRQANR